jgi:hypothetical protein
MGSVPISSVESPRHLTFQTPTQAHFEVYSGSVVVGFKAGGSLQHTQLVTFVPVSTNVLQAYPNSGSLLDFTVMVAVTGMADDDDESNFFEVGKTDLKLDYTPFPPGSLAAGSGAQYWVLKLIADLACHNGRIQRISYKITALTSREDRQQEITLIDPHFTP